MMNQKRGFIDSIRCSAMEIPGRQTTMIAKNIEQTKNTSFYNLHLFCFSQAALDGELSLCSPLYRRNNCILCGTSMLKMLTIKPHRVP